MTERVESVVELVRALPDAPERARSAVRARPIVYALGSGEADEVALCAGIKPLLRQVVRDADVAATRARFEALGLVVRDAVHRVETASTRGRVLFVGRDARRVEEAVRVEAAPEHDHELGRLLGYPRCCVEAYLAVPPPRDNLDAIARGGVGRARLNVLDLAVFHYVSWIPCSLSCALSSAYADAVASHIAERHAQFLAGRGARPVSRCPPGCRHETFVRAIDDALGAHRLVLFEDVQLSLRGTIDRDVLRVAEVWPTARDRHPDARLDDLALEAVARLLVLVERAERVAVIDGVLSLDDRAIVSAPHAALHRFS
ncbi:DUF483 domain-containing protein [Sandaracinus amylolyticus]|uniref:DUF483 domain-containing protein n=1 Tax=Sandaracinus amylolyticus TaxID=927083 RepID=UPI001F3F3D25|nr:DUF483 domain-containing protein [Sandaracinus amylolyticus]